MRVGSCLVIGGLSLSISTVAAHGQFVPIPQEIVETDRVPVTGPYQLGSSVYSAPESSILYSNKVETGSRFNPGTGGNPLGSGIQQDITFDDIPIPNSRLFGAGAIDVTRVTVGLRRAGDAPAVDVNLYWATAATTTVAPDTELDVPFNFFATQSLAARSDAAFITELVTFGDGSTPLFTAPLNSTLFDGYGTFLLGLQFSSADTRNGWRLTNGTDLNANVMWIFDSDVANPEGAFNFGTSGPSATFYIEVQGAPVPEPACLSMIAMTSLALLRRRR